MALTKEQLDAYVRGLCKEKNIAQATIDKLVAGMQADPDQLAALSEILEIPQKALEATRALQKENEDWREKKVVPFVQQKVQEAEAAKAQAADALKKLAAVEARYGNLEEAIDLGDGTSRTPSGDIVKKADIDKLMADTRTAQNREFLQVTLDSNRLRQQHFKLFGALLDEEPLWAEVAKAAMAKDPITGESKQITLIDAYELVHGAEVKKKETEAAAARDEQLRMDGEKRALQRIAQGGVAGAHVREGSEGDVFSIITATEKEGYRPESDQDRLSSFARDLADPALAAGAGPM